MTDSIKSLGLALILDTADGSLMTLKAKQEAINKLTPEGMAVSRTKRTQIKSEQHRICFQAELLKELLCIPYVEHYKVVQELEYLRFRYRNLQLELEGLTQVVTLKEMSDTDYVLGHTAICMLLANLSESVQVGNKFAGSQIDEVASQILALQSLTIEDIILCIHKARNGHYGDIFRLDGLVVMRWIEEYRKAQHVFLIDYHDSLHSQFVSPTRSREMDGAEVALHRVKVEQTTRELAQSKKTEPEP